MSFWSGLAKIGAVAGAPFTGGASLSALPLIDVVGAGAGAASQASASNRGTQAQLLMDQDLMRLRAREDQRTGEGDALKKLAQTGYLQRGGANFKPSTPYSYSFAPQGATDAQKQGAATLEQELLRRLQGGQMQLADYSKQAKPSFWERLGGVVSAVAPAVSGAVRSNSMRLPGQI